MTTPNSAPGPRAYVLLLLLGLSWGVAFYFFKLALPTMTPAAINLGRLGVAAIALFLLMRARRETLPPWGPVWRYLIVVALLGNTLPYFLIAEAERSVPSGLAAILTGATPLLTMAMAHFATADEKITWSRLAGLFGGFLGLVLLIGPQALAGVGSHLFGQLLLLLTCLSFAANAIVARRMPALPLATTAFCVSLIGTIAMFPVALAVDPGMQYGPDLPAILAVVGLGLITTAAAALLFFELVREAGATFVVSANYLVPVVAVALGVLLLDEEPDPLALAAFVLISAGIWLAHRGRQ